MKTLKTLIRLYKFKLDEKQQALKLIRDEIMRLHHFIESLNERLEMEIKKTNEDPALAFAFPAFAKQIDTQKKKALADIQALEIKEEKKKEELRQAFQELKKFEIIKEAKEKTMKEEADKREQDILDEIAIQKHDTES
ncbi:MAG: flagellar export protein FliJ [Alphaproteobacteria bacterium]